jgi:hypothetical protein
MSNAVAHIATIAAYPIKDELGGGYRGVYKAVDMPRVPSDRFATLEEAKFWAKNKAWELHPNCRYAALNRKGEYQANVWVDV